MTEQRAANRVAYSYPGGRLDNPGSEIRLLSFEDTHLEPCRLSCRTVHVSLLDAPSFTALSYVWGDPFVTEDITLDNQPYTTTVNLADALRHVRRHWQDAFPCRDPRELLFWADALCINQGDPAERSAQVQLMGSIFSRAELVLARLDDHSKSLETALENLRLIARNVSTIEEDSNIQGLVGWMRHYPVYLESESWNMIQEFADLEYWRRVWIFQEMVLARRLVFYSDTTSITREILDTVVGWAMLLGGKAKENIRSRPDWFPDAFGITLPHAILSTGRT
ncbi:heterokaryon incompatibility protein-domain-containing protein [Xylariales sp. PMI_506]|nr:heterokaryon incompatibility protein-domain-containing protein [Xylariales sp. PMI_506]